MVSPTGQGETPCTSVWNPLRSHLCPHRSTPSLKVSHDLHGTTSGLTSHSSDGASHSCTSCTIPPSSPTCASDLVSRTSPGLAHPVLMVPLPVPTSLSRSPRRARRSISPLPRVPPRHPNYCSSHTAGLASLASVHLSPTLSTKGRWHLTVVGSCPISAQNQPLVSQFMWIKTLAYQVTCPPFTARLLERLDFRTMYLKVSNGQWPPGQHGINRSLSPSFLRTGVRFWSPRRRNDPNHCVRAYGN